MVSKIKINGLLKFGGLVAILIFAFFSVYSLALAAGPTEPTEEELKGEEFNVRQLKADDGQQEQSYLDDTENAPVVSFILQVVNFLSEVIGVLAILAIIIGGLIWITGGSNENAISRGKDIVTYAVIGLIVAFAAYLLVAFVQSAFYFKPSEAPPATTYLEENYLT